MKKLSLLIAVAILSAATVFPTISIVAASVNDSSDPVSISSAPEYPTTDGEAVSNPDVSSEHVRQGRDATGQHTTMTLVSTKVTKRKLLKVMTPYSLGGVANLTIGKSLSGTASVSDGIATVSFTFGGTTSAGFSYNVPAGRYGAVGYYADVTATRYQVKVLSNLNNSLISTYYTTACTLSNKYFGLHLK